MKLNIFRTIFSEKIETLKKLTKLEKIVLILGAAVTVLGYVYFVTRPKFYNFTSESYKFLVKWHDRTPIFQHFWILYGLDLFLTALWIIIPFLILFFWTLAEHKRRKSCSSNL